LIRYYAKADQDDAGGSFTALKLGGSPDVTASDLSGPDVRLFIDNENFVTGDKVSKSPILIAYLDDESGINSSGGGIGHDITATIDDKTDEILLLNDYFQSGKDSYKNGKVIYQIPDAEDGEHTLKFKVWDLANNSTEKEIRFSVSSVLAIRSLIAFPNPVSGYTDIVAEHNRFGEKLAIDIDFFTQQGVLVDQLKTESGSSGFNTEPIRWNPGLNIHKLTNGIYHYRYRITTLDGSTAVKSGQLILTR